jgi:hypothetical protein
MSDRTNVGGRDRLVRVLLAVVLTVVSLKAFKKGKKLRGTLAGLGALGAGFNAVTCFCGLNEALDVDTTAEPAGETISITPSDELPSDREE